MKRNIKTGEVVRDFQKKDKRIYYFKKEEQSGGPAEPLNIGIKMAKGDYIAILESDDEWLPKKIEKQMLFLEKAKNNLGMVYCLAFNISEKSKTMDIRGSEEKLIYELRRPIWSLSTVIIKKEVFNVVGLFDKRFKFLADTDFYIRLGIKYKIGYIKEPLVNYYNHDNNLVGQKMAIDSKESLKEYRYIKKKYARYIK